MEAGHIDLRLELPADPRWAPMLRELAVHAASRCGSARGKAPAFGLAVEEAVRDACTGGGAGAVVTCVVRCPDGIVEVVVAGGRGSRTLRLE